MGDRGECFVTVVFIKEWEAFVGEKLDPKNVGLCGVRTRDPRDEIRRN